MAPTDTEKGKKNQLPQEWKSGLNGWVTIK
jgi:hypothetical protein